MSLASTPEELHRVTELLGGGAVFAHPPRSTLEAHHALMQGLPGRALTCLVGNLRVLKPSRSLERAVGISLRTYQRRRESPDKLLGQEQSGRAWKFAEILAKATEVFGSQDEAEAWLERPATGLDQCRPLDLLATPAGTEIVEDFLERLRYGVYT